ncbi:MAG: hypothetical protein AB7K09_07515 [Planctomycetota bacterium]
MRIQLQPEFRRRLRRLSPAGVLLGALLISGTLALGNLMPRALDFPNAGATPEDEREAMWDKATDASEAGDFVRAWDWFKSVRASERALDLPERPITVAELRAGYEAGDARHALFAEREYKTFIGHVQAAIAESGDKMITDAFARFEPPIRREVVDYALPALLMRPTLRRIARHAAGLPDDPRNDTEAPTEVTPAEIKRRLRAVFSFIRDTVSVVPERDSGRTPGDFRYPLMTLFEGYGNLHEVNWLLCDAMRAVCPAFTQKRQGSPDAVLISRVDLVELTLATPAVLPRRNESIPGAAGEAAGVDAGSSLNPGGGAIVLALINNGPRPCELVAFDAFAGVPLLDPQGELVDLFGWLAGRTTLHPVLIDSLGWATETQRVTHGRPGVFRNLLEESPVDVWLRRHGIGEVDAPASFPGRARHVQTLLNENLDAGRIPRQPLPDLAVRFPWLWPARVVNDPGDGAPESAYDYRLLTSRWLDAERDAAFRSLADPHAVFRHELQDEARADNRSIRQIALDHRRADDAVERYTARVNRPVGADEMRDICLPPQTERGLIPSIGTVIYDGTSVRMSGDRHVWRITNVTDQDPLPFVLLNLSATPVEVTFRFSVGRPDALQPYDAFQVDGADADGRMQIRHGGLLAIKLVPGKRRGRLAAQFDVIVRPVGASESAGAQTGTALLIVDQASAGVIPGLPLPYVGGPLHHFAITTSNLLPVIDEMGRRRIRELQARFGAGVCEYLDGEHHNAVMSFADYLAGLKDRGEFDHSRLPAMWEWQARFLRGQSLVAINRQPDALPVLQAIPTIMPLGVAARLLEQDPAALVPVGTATR